MKADKLFILGGGVILVGAVLFFAFTHKAAGSSSDIMSMAKSGASETELLAAVDKSSSTSRPTADDVVALKQAGVSDKVIIALLHKNAPQQASATK